jgi:type IV secretory pathway VirB6-like protein
MLYYFCHFLFTIFQTLFIGVWQVNLETKLRRSSSFRYPILKFNETVISIVDETIAKTSTNPKHQGKPWINDDCKDAITNRKNG